MFMYILNSKKTIPVIALILLSYIAPNAHSSNLLEEALELFSSDAEVLRSSEIKSACEIQAKDLRSEPDWGALERAEKERVATVKAARSLQNQQYVNCTRRAGNDCAARFPERHSAEEERDRSISLILEKKLDFQRERSALKEKCIDNRRRAQQLEEQKRRQVEEEKRRQLERQQRLDGQQQLERQQQLEKEKQQAVEKEQEQGLANQRYIEQQQQIEKLLKQQQLLLEKLEERQKIEELPQRKKQ